MKHQGFEPAWYSNSNYSKYNMHWRNFNSNYKWKGEYYNHTEDGPESINSIAKTSQLIKNNSEQTLFQDQKSRNYTDLIRNSSKGVFPQTARHDQASMPRMVDNLKFKPQSSWIVSPQKLKTNRENENTANEATKIMTSINYSNIF